MMNMLKRNQHGQVTGSIQKISTKINAQILVGDGWAGTAYAELMRLSLEVGVYHSQLEGEPGHEETGRAVESLKAAYTALNKKYGSEDERDGGLELQLEPER
jgi:hypothetical protein